MSHPRFKDAAQLAAGAEMPRDFWQPVIFTAEEIDAEVERLAVQPAPADGRRESIFVHPRSTEPGIGLLPGIRVTLAVLAPGERSEPIRQNSTQIGFCIRGRGAAVIAGKRIDFSQYDAWNIPSYRTHWHVNDGEDLQVRLVYSNAPLLEKLNVHIVEPNPPEGSRVTEEGASAAEPRRQSPFGVRALGADGAMLMPYELLVNPPPLESRPLHWPWAQVKRQLDELVALGSDYAGRRLYLLYNPATGRTNGTTPSFFATITMRPPGIVDRPHRHVSAAVNYYFHGRGRSVVEEQRYEWKAGDLMLSAPGWAMHNHASYDDDVVYELTVQDQPLHIAMESLLWQEDLHRPPRLLGAEEGFETNRTGR
jgi:gentisate 1,2-dioxygenase